MYQLTEQEVGLIEDRLKEQVQQNEVLLFQLLDHICCFIETELSDDVPFENAYQNAIAAVCPNGAHEIEEEAFFLLTYKTQTNMKRILFSMGFLSTFLISFGFLFKLMHWPFATMMLIGGLCAMFCTLVVLAVYSVPSLKSMALPMRVRIVTGLFCGSLIVVGSIFKALHYPGASIIIVTGMVLLNIVFLPLFFYQLYRKSLA